MGMRYAKIGDLNSSRIVLGTDHFGSITTREDAFRLMDLFRDLGGNHLDTARLYSRGMSESVIGAYFRERGKGNWIITTKGAHPDVHTMQVPRLSREEIASDLEGSLFALGTDCIDLYLLHRDDRTREVGEILETLNGFIREGKVRQIGCSNWRTDRIREANRYAMEHGLVGFSVSQIQMSIAHTLPGAKVDRTTVEMDPGEYAGYRELGLPVMAFSSQACGFFSVYAEGTEEKLKTGIRSVFYGEENLKKAEYVKTLAEKYGVSAAAVVVASVLSRENPDVFALIGGKRPDMITDSVSGADLLLSEKENEFLFGGITYAS